MLLIEIGINYLITPHNSIFISPYLLTFFIMNIIFSVVLLKGEICKGQQNRLLFILPLMNLFSLVNATYSIGFTPKYTPFLIVHVSSIILPFIYFKLSQAQSLRKVLLYSSLGLSGIGILQYLIIYWIELLSLFNSINSNNFAQFLLALLLSVWYLILSKSRLDNFIKLLAKVALLILVLNYIWVGFIFIQLHYISTTVNIGGYALYFITQFIIFIMLAWILLGKNIKNVTAWNIATLLSLIYPLASFCN